MSLHPFAREPASGSTGSGAGAGETKVQVALLQLAVNGFEDYLTRLSRVTQGVAAAAEAGAGLAVLPELWTTGAFDITGGLGAAEPSEGPTTDALSRLAQRWQLWLHGGSFLERDGDEVFNTSVVFDPNGEPVAQYRKIHLFGFDEGEAAILTAGDQVVVTPTPLGLTGLATCYDLRFPELFRTMSAQGAEAILLCSSWPVARIAHWRTLVAARAIENQALVLACNATGTHAGVPLGGESMVTDATGMQLAMTSHEETVLLTTVDPSGTARARAAFPVLRDRQLPLAPR